VMVVQIGRHGPGSPQTPSLLAAGCGRCQAEPVQPAGTQAPPGSQGVTQGKRGGPAVPGRGSGGRASGRGSRRPGPGGRSPLGPIRPDPVGRGWRAALGCGRPRAPVGGCSPLAGPLGRRPDEVDGFGPSWRVAAPGEGGRPAPGGAPSAGQHWPGGDVTSRGGRSPLTYPADAMRPAGPGKRTGGYAAPGPAPVCRPGGGGSGGSAARPVARARGPGGVL
jgi:translation initiation factor IF-2